jgi:hypothetical protein
MPDFEQSQSGCEASSNTAQVTVWAIDTQQFPEEVLIL